MNTNRYYFSNFIEDDTLSILAVQTKELLQQNDNIVNIFQINNQLLYGHSPKRALFLMKQNSKSIFSSNPDNENNPMDAKSYQGLSTPVTSIPDISNMPRRHLPLDDVATLEPNNPVRRQTVIATLEPNTPVRRQTVIATLEPNTPVRRQTVIVSPKKKVILNSTIDETAARYEQFASRIVSTDSPEAGNQESPRSTEIAKMTANLTIAEKDMGISAKVVGNIDTSSQESPRSAEVSIMTTSLCVVEKELGSPVKVVGDINILQESPLSTKITRMTSSLTVDGKESSSFIQDDQMAGNSTKYTDSLNIKKKIVKSDNPDSTNKDSISHAEEMVKILTPTRIGSEIPSPAKRSKICDISALDIQEFADPAEKVRIADSSPEDIEAIIRPIPGDKINISPNEARKGIVRGSRKRKSFSPAKKNTTLFRSTPRIIQLAGEAEINVEVHCDLDDHASPSTSRSSSTDYRNDPLKDSTESPVAGKSKTDTTPKSILEWYLRRSEKAISIGSVSGTNLPSSDEYVFSGKYPSYVPSIAATAARDRSTKSESSQSGIKTFPFTLTHTILEFNSLLVLRGQTLERMHCYLLSFQSGIQFLGDYVHSLAHTVLKIYISVEENSIMELKETVNDASAIALKLREKLASWKRDVDWDVNTWQKCLQQIQQLKAQYEPLLTDDFKPAVTFEVVQVYEKEIKAVWKTIDDMVMIGDSRRALFSQIAYDLDKIMKMFAKCLVLVGILQPV